MLEVGYGDERGLEGVSGAGGEEGIGEVGVAVVSHDGLIKIDDCNVVNGEGTLAGINDTVKYGFNVRYHVVEVVS